MIGKPKYRVKQSTRIVRRRKKEIGQRVLLNGIEQEKETTLRVGELELKISLSRSTVHVYNNIKICTESLGEDENCVVKVQLYSPTMFSGHKNFWHLFDKHRNTFCIPFASEDIRPDDQNKEDVKEIQKLIYSESEPFVSSSSTPTKDAYLKIVVGRVKNGNRDPETWNRRNHQFPWADVTLRLENGQELHVNRRVLYTSSRYFNRVIYRGEPKVLRNWEVLHVKHVSFEDLFDLLGYIYHDWCFDVHHSIHLQSVAEKFGVMYHSTNTSDFEGRTGLDLLSRRCYNMCQRNESVRYYHRVEVKRKKLAIMREEDPEHSFETSDIDHADENDEDDVPIDPVFAPWPGPDVLNIKDHNGDTVESYQSDHAPPTYQPPLAELANDDPEVRFAIELLDEGEQFFKTVEEGTSRKEKPRYGFYAFRFEPDWEEGELTRGERVTVNAGFVKWDMYLYPQSLNNSDYLSLGIHMLGMQSDWFYETRMSIRVTGQNSIGAHKIVTHVFSHDRTNFGYPDFMRWSDVLRCAGGMVEVVVHVQVKFKRVEEVVVLPGVKDALLQVDGMIIPVSRDVLSEASPVLESLLRPGLIVDRTQLYTVAGVNCRVFMELLYCIYHRQCTDDELRIVLLFLCVKLEIGWLKEQLMRGCERPNPHILKVLDDPEDRVKYLMMMENWKGFHWTGRRAPLTLKQF